jgi:hypothetical protein
MPKKKYRAAEIIPLFDRLAGIQDKQAAVDDITEHYTNVFKKDGVGVLGHFAFEAEGKPFLMMLTDVPPKAADLTDLVRKWV